jgi:hypothetical protein
MKLQHVPVEHVHTVWSKVEGYIADAISNQKGQPDYTLEQVKTFITMGNWMLAVITDNDNNIKGAGVINFFNRPNDRVAFVLYVGGRMIANKDMHTQLCALCKSFGATKIECAANEVASRLWRKLGFEEKYRIAEVSIL